MKLTIITINLNNAIGLKKTIESILNQTYKDFEYIIIDGGSGDESAEIIKQHNSNINYWVSEKDKGIYNAMNKGINKANGEYLLFLNSGDYLCDGNVIKKIIPNLNHYDIVYGDMVIDNNGILNYAKSPQFLEFEEMIRGTLWHPVSFIKKELFNKYGLYNENFKIISDYEFFIKTIYLNRCSTYHVNIFITVFNTSGIGSSEKYNALHLEEKNKVHLTYFHPSIIKSALDFAKLKRSKAQIIYRFIKTKPLIYKSAKCFYNFAKHLV